MFFSQEESEYFPKEWKTMDFSLFGKGKRENGKLTKSQNPKKQPRTFMKTETEILHEKELGIRRSIKVFSQEDSEYFHPKEWKTIHFSLFGNEQKRERKTERNSQFPIPNSQERIQILHERLIRYF